LSLLAPLPKKVWVIVFESISSFETKTGDRLSSWVAKKCKFYFTGSLIILQHTYFSIKEEKIASKVTSQFVLKQQSQPSKLHFDIY